MSELELESKDIKVCINPNEVKINDAQLSALDDAWADGYKIVLEKHKNAVTLSSTRKNLEEGDKNVTKEWKSIKAQLEEGVFPEQYLGEALKDKEKDRKMEKNNKKTEVTEINTAAKKTETTAKQTAESAPSLDKVVKKSLKMQHNTKEAAKDKPAASANEELKNYIGTEFPVTVPDKITQDEPFDVFSGNPELRRYADSVLGKTAYLKIWPEMNARGEIRIGFRYRGVSASEITMKYRNREKIIGNNTCLSFLKNYKRVDAFMLKGLYHVLSEIIPKIDEITTISDDDMGLEETYARIILMGEKVVSDDHTITQEIKTASEKGKKYLCFCGKTALEKMLKDVGASMKRREFLSLLKYPEEGNSLLLVDDGRCYDHRGGGDYDHWYYIRVDDSIIKKYRKANEEA